MNESKPEQNYAIEITELQRAVKKQRRQIRRSRLIGWLIQLPITLALVAALVVIGFDRTYLGNDDYMKAGHYDVLSVGTLVVKPSSATHKEGLNSGVVLYDAADRPIAGLTSIDGATGFMLFDTETEELVASLTAGNSSGIFSLYKTDGTRLAYIGQSTAGTPLVKITDGERSLAVLGALDSGSGALTLHDAEGNERTMLSAAIEGRNTIRALDSKGRLLATLGQLLDGRAFLELHDAERDGESQMLVPLRD